MPEFSVYASTPAAHSRHEALDDFTRAYVEAALWMLDEEHTDPEDGAYSADVSRLSDAAYERAKADCAAFQTENADALAQAYAHPSASYNAVQAGHDFFLTRNGHGAGFWDRGLGVVGDQLTKAAERFQTAELYAGDDGLLYFD